MSRSGDWHGAAAPSLTDFEAMAAAAWERLPEAFREKSSDLLIRVDDFATNEVLQALGLSSPFELLGLYHGVSLDKKSVMDLQRQPDVVFLYRRPILEEWAQGDETLDDLITHVLIHEIGHHFGFSDDDMARIEAGKGS
jgi:predicted Zn-dependent protease with MMP-like domain